MKGLIKVVTEQEYKFWLAQQKPSYKPAETAPVASPAPVADSAKTAAAGTPKAVLAAN
jgi:cytochrome c oxidase subunit 2